MDYKYAIKMVYKRSRLTREIDRNNAVYNFQETQETLL